jgi:hypothetical protein
MKSWKTRLGLVLTTLAMVLVVSIPAVADDDRDCINRDGDRFCEVNGNDHFTNFDREDIRDLCDDDIGDEDDCDRDDLDDLLDDLEADDLGFFDASDIEVDDLRFVCGDNDLDGSADEDPADGLDNDVDGLLDEDANLFECDDLFLLGEVDVD